MQSTGSPPHGGEPLFIGKEDAMTHRSTSLALALSGFLVIAACESQYADDIHVIAAGTVTKHYSRSRLSKWDVRASAAGTDCTILLVRTSVIMDDGMVESLHYGAGKYDVWEGGLQQFCRERGFRGVVYKDEVERVWTYGAVTSSEGESIEECR
jgi:hypothetical protein